jgi:serine/threonine protein kinase
MEGTQLFLPPECCSFDVQSYSMKKTDIWAFGVTLYCLAFNRLPFSIGHSPLDIMSHICEDELKFEGRKISDEFK